ncbi:hypothetical protein [Actinomadura rupiterrae]|uniref:hypothetical protein n=1 Tax=Actinomadura rupiterrae TaxID=559627 RepID=UPI0020A4DA76|nr:hypothetical protein [Actinomadura rupiterrae]MCP2342046.1 hypothetical protein [Actinomadura rupiterrae]
MEDLGPLWPGWHAERVGGLVVARRVGGLTDYQLIYGYLEQVEAKTVSEIVVICKAHNILAQWVAIAEASQGEQRAVSS